MSSVFPGRFTADTDDSFVVFLIGMRINNLLAVRKWVPTALAMPPMLRELEKDPDSGFLGGHTFMRWREVMTIQYWRSFEDLEHFARSPSDPHLDSWRRFNKAVGANGSVGIWHETYIVESDRFEAVYGNMPQFGLAAATAHVPATGRRETARRRLGGDNEPAVPTPE